MISIKDIPYPVAWYDGMPVTQHHFQQEAQRYQQLVQFHTGVLSPYYWGIKELDIEKTGIHVGKLQIRSVEGVFPDGMEFYFSGTENDFLELDLSQFDTEIQDVGITVYLTATTNLTYSKSGPNEDDRYVTFTETVYEDQLTKNNPVEIVRSKPILHLVAVKNANDETLPLKYTGFPIAKISYKEANYHLENYVAPSLIVNDKTELHEICSQIIAKMRHKTNYLSEKLQSITQAFGMGTTLEIKDMLRSISTMLPAFEIMFGGSGIHPFQLYVNLGQVLGSLAALEPSMKPPRPKPYDHVDLLEVFTHISGHITRILDQGVNETYTQVAFDLDSETGMFTLNLSPELFSNELILGVIGPSKALSDDVVTWFGNTSICSSDFIDQVKNRRIHGAESSQYDGNENLVPLRGTNLFKISTESDYILKGEDLNIFNISESIGSPNFPVKIVLFVKTQ